MAVITTGSTPSTKASANFGGPIPFVKPGDLDQSSPILETKQMLSKEGAASCRLVRPGATLVSCIGNLGKVGIAGKPLATNQQINAVEFRSEVVDDRYGYYFCRTLRPWMETEASATTIAILNKSRFSSAPFLLAPRGEQRRIADSLDSLTERINACRERLDRVPKIVKRFREAVIEAAVSGRLTEAWRSGGRKDYQSVSVMEPYHHSIFGACGWKRTNLGSICEFVGGSQPPKATFKYEDGPDLVRLIQIRDYKSDKHRTYIPRSLAKRFCTAEDIMIARYGPPIFQIMRGLDGAYNVALMKAVPRDHLTARSYLFYLLQSSKLLRFVEAGSDRTAGQDGVRKDQLESYPVFLPPVSEQTEIVRRVEQLLRFSNALWGKFSTAVDKAEKLTPSVFAKAFQGELVPQDPREEPADSILKRLSRSPVTKTYSRKTWPRLKSNSRTKPAV